MQDPQRKRGFTLIELVVVVSILAVLSGVLVPRIRGHVEATRDAERLDDLKTIRNAIEQFLMDRGTLPGASGNSKYGGWDVSHDGDFIAELVDAGYLDAMPTDPVNDEIFHYRYYVYEPGAYDCKGGSKYYVLGIKAFENETFAAQNHGFFRCDGRDWSREFAFVTGGGPQLRR